MWLIYSWIIRCYFFGIKLASFWRADARRWTEARKDFFPTLLKKKKQNIPENKPCIWVHVSSLGEFEQGRSLLERIKKSYPELPICLSFFSPSGYENRKNYSLVDLVCYFPSDNRKDVLQFLDIINPKIVIFVKYDFWFNTLLELKNRNIPYFFISMNISKNSYLRKNICNPLLNELKCATHLFLQNEENYSFLHEHGFSNVSVCGDTRLDRVLQIAEEKSQLETIEKFASNDKCLVLGSSWSPEIELLQTCLSNNELSHWKIIVAPHHPDEEHVLEIERYFPNQTTRFSQLDYPSKILIIDQIGLLSRLYNYADLVFIGGGFGQGIHNTLEPAAFLCPMCFGPKFFKFQEAIDFIELGAAKVIRNADDLRDCIQFAEAEQNKSAIKLVLKKWIDHNKGATERIFQFLEPIITKPLPQEN